MTMDSTETREYRSCATISNKMSTFTSKRYEMEEISTVRNYFEF